MPEQSDLARQVLDDLAGITPIGEPKRPADLQVPEQGARQTEPIDKEPPEPSFGYLGQSTYRRKRRGLRKKIAIYVSPSAASALRRAAATGEDPRGASMGDIVEALLRAHGYV